MKKTIMLSLLIALSVATRATDYSYMVFTLNDNTTQSIPASDLSITFSGGNLIATSGSSTVTIALSNLQKMAFSNESSTTGIQAIESAALTIDDATEIYDMNGRRIPSGSQLSRGIYIIKSNGRTSKVQVK